jgi:hypothetical protein
MTNTTDRFRRNRLRLVALCLAFAIVSLLYRALYLVRLETSSLMFVAVPVALTILLVLTVRPKSALGTALFGVTVGLLLSAVLLGEGVVCVVMAAPICYLVAAIVGWAIDRSRRGSSGAMLVLIPVLLSSIEGVHDRLAFSRDEAVTAQVVVNAPADRVEAALSEPWRVDGELPPFLKLGFPTPFLASGSGLRVGDERTVRFHDMPRDGALTMRIDRREDGRATFQPVSDDTMIAHWLKWRGVSIAWSPIDRDHTRLQWTMEYRRQLDPAWYFGPVERYAVRLAADSFAREVAASAERRAR